MANYESPIVKTIKLTLIYFIFITGLSLVGHVYSAEIKPMSNITLDTVMKQLDHGEPLSTKDIMIYGEQPDAIKNLISELKAATLNQRVHAIGLLTDLGRVMIAADDIFPERPGPIVVEPQVIAYMTEQLGDKDKDIRNPACITLAALVPAELFQQYNETIIQALTKYPETDAAIVLLGKVKSPKSMALLRKTEVSGASPEDAQMAMARLGDELAEQGVINNYLKSESVQEKAEQARRLGYVSSDKSIKLLAEEIRSPDYYEWHPPAIRSLRVHIIEGLHLAFMQETLFWQPLIPPVDDSYYESIEKWLTENVGVTWKQDRPEFLYQIDSPIMPPG